MDLYISQQKNQLLDSLETQVRFSQLVAVVVGAKGLGKTFLVERLQQRLGDEVALASIDASLAMSEDQLDKTISLQLGLSWQESSSSLSERIVSTHSQKVLITIDDAHLLSPSCLEFILKLNQSQLGMQESRLFILLAGDKNLPNLISNTQTYAQHPEMCVVFELEAIQQSETKLVVDSFGHPNGKMLNGLKEHSKLDYFWQLSKGNPAELNYHVSRWLDEHSPTQIVEVKASHQGTYLKSTIYAILVVGLLTMLIYQDEINQWVVSGGEISQADESAEAAKLTEELTYTKNSTGDLETSLDKPESNNTEVSDAVSSESKASDLREPEKTKELTEKRALESDSELALLNNSNSKVRKTKGSELPKELLEKSLVENNNQPKVASILTKEELKLLDQDSTYFVLQWVVVSSQSAAEKYRETHRAKEQMSTFRQLKNGKTLYMVVSDHFSNRALAEFAKNNYVQQGVKENPWIKSLSSIQKEIRLFEQEESK